MGQNSRKRWRRSRKGREEEAWKEKKKKLIKRTSTKEWKGKMKWFWEKVYRGKKDNTGHGRNGYL